MGLFPSIMYGGPSATRQTHLNAVANLAQARAEAREFGEERRREIRRRVQEYREQAENAGGDIHGRDKP